jgi:hypothetical protein
MAKFSLDWSKFDWQHALILTFGGIGALAEYLETAVPSTAPTDKAIMAICGGLVVLLGHTSNSLLVKKQPEAV